MAKLWEQFYPHVQPFVPGCPEVVIDQHLLDAAADFCERSEVWKYNLDRDSTIAGLSEYTLDPPSGALIENVVALYLDGALLKRVSDLDFKDYPDRGNAKPTCFSVYEDQQVRFYPTPDKAYSFTGVCVLKPSLSATGVEDFIFETHRKTIACGAVASLAVIPGKEWSNPELSAYYTAKFHKAMDDAKGRDTRRANFRAKNVKFA